MPRLSGPARLERHNPCPALDLVSRIFALLHRTNLSLVRETDMVIVGASYMVPQLDLADSPAL